MSPLEYDHSRHDNYPEIIDIRSGQLDLSLENEIVNGLTGREYGEKSLPTMLLYSAEGLRLFEDITYIDEYYQTNTEISVLEKHAVNMADRIEDGSIVLELGSGNLRKVGILLDALNRQEKTIDYYALDLDASELKRTLALLPTTQGYVKYHGLHGTYEDGLVWLKTSPKAKDRPRCVLWLGSSVGNYDRSKAAEFLRSFSSDALRAKKSDCMLVGLDGCKDGEKVYKAYNDPQGYTERFIMCGLSHANTILGGDYFAVDDWEYVGEWNDVLGRHQAYYAPKKDICFEGKLEGVVVKQGERVNIEYSYKFDKNDADTLWEEAGLVESARWTNADVDYSLHMVQKPSFHFPSCYTKYAAEPAPRISEWKDLWSAWDTVTLDMIPRDKLVSKPIDLRNPCIFYLGHIPTFLDNLLSKATKSKPTQPTAYLEIFLRGIDPNVDDPEQCHLHSQIPEFWPELEEILSYSSRVRQRVTTLYRKGSASHQPSDVQRALWLGFEHEAMHLETLLYMLLRFETTQPPPGLITPDFASLVDSERGRHIPHDSHWVRVPEVTLDVGMNDNEDSMDSRPHHFGWDNEKPIQKNIKIDSFLARVNPITNEEYTKYLYTTSYESIPTSWAVKINDEKGNNFSGMKNYGNEFLNFIDTYEVRTLFGRVPLRLALDWPVMASYDEIAGCVQWMGGRIPTKNEVVAIYMHAEQTDKVAEKKLSGKIDAVNGHLAHNGVSETPPQDPLFSNLANRNVGFKHWHPTSVRSRGGKLLGRGETGGAWEWTSSKLKPHDGFMPGKFYPEYTADFFDGNHNIMLGGSWATHPRIAGRKSFINWYQRKYKYMWATARIVKDL